MSVHAYKTKDGTHWQVRWRETDGRVQTRSLRSKQDAIAFDVEVKARKNKGHALPRPGKLTLAEAYDDWFHLDGKNLASTTQRTYRAVWDAHVRGRFDHHRLSELAAHPRLFRELMAEMRDRGVGNAAQRKVLVVISSVLSAAVEDKEIETNPLWRMRKPPATPQRYPHPFPPVVVERIRLRMMRRDSKDASGIRPLRDACLVTLMSYAGLRPGEALALTWADVASHTIVVDKAVRDGLKAGTKTGAIRTVKLIAPLQSDLDALRLASGLGSADQLVLPSQDGDYWSRSEFNNWRNRVWKPVLKDIAGHHTLASIADARPYDCRGTFVSLHLRAGANPLEVARWSGHSKQVMFDHYANVIEEIQAEHEAVRALSDGSDPRLPVEEQIQRAREATEQREREELDALTADLLEHPTISHHAREPIVVIVPGKMGVPPGQAAQIFYGPRGQ